jgi:hypothetical protein
MLWCQRSTTTEVNRVSMHGFGFRLLCFYLLTSNSELLRPREAETYYNKINRKYFNDILLILNVIINDILK